MQNFLGIQFSLFTLCPRFLNLNIIVLCLAASLASTHYMPVALSSCEKQKSFQILTAKLPPVEDLCPVPIESSGKIVFLFE